MNPSLRFHLADVLADLGFCDSDDTDLADALLADPTLAAIIDLAASHVDGTFDVPPPSPEVRALLAAWRATVEEREFAKRVELND